MQSVALGGGERTDVCPGRFTAEGRALITCWLGWVGPGASLDAPEKRKFPAWIGTPVCWLHIL